MSNHELSLCGEDAPAFIFECNRYQREAPRFAALFREVWGRIPDTDRKAIVQYARSKRLAQPYVFVWLKKSREMQSPAHYDDGKKWMVFDGERILGFPGNGIALAIAEELGHLYLYAIGDDTHTAPRPKERQAIIEWDGRREEAVKQVLGRWGFDLAEHTAFVEWGKRWDWGRSGGWLGEPGV